MKILDNANLIMKVIEEEGGLLEKIDMIKVGERIAERRRELNISQQEACTWLGVSQNHYSRIENGHAGMSLELLIDISNYLHLSTDYILTGEYATDAFPAVIEKLNKLPLEEKKHIERYIALFMDYVEASNRHRPKK